MNVFNLSKLCLATIEIILESKPEDSVEAISTSDLNLISIELFNIFLNDLTIFEVLFLFELCV